MPFGAVQLVATMLGAYVAMVTKLKSPVLMFLSIPPIIGCVILLVISHDASHRGPLLVGYYLVGSVDSCIKSSAIQMLMYCFPDIRLPRDHPSHIFMASCEHRG